MKKQLAALENKSAEIPPDQQELLAQSFLVPSKYPAEIPPDQQESAESNKEEDEVNMSRLSWQYFMVSAGRPLAIARARLLKYLYYPTPNEGLAHAQNRVAAQKRVRLAETAARLALLLSEVSRNSPYWEAGDSKARDSFPWKKMVAIPKEKLEKLTWDYGETHGFFTHFQKNF